MEGSIACFDRDVNMKIFDEHKNAIYDTLSKSKDFSKPV